MLIINGTVHTMEGLTIPGGYVDIRGDKIAGTGPMEECPKSWEGEVFDAQGGHIQPGFVDAHCHLGMFGDSTGIEGDDGNEATDPCTPHLRAVDAVNPMDRSFQEAREAGVTTVLTGPGSANPISGQFAALKTNGRWVDAMVLKAPAAMKLALGENPKLTYHERHEGPITRMATAAVIRENLAKAVEYRDKLEAERAKVVEKAQAEARSIIEEARAASDLAISELKELQKRKDLDWQQVNDGRAQARHLLNEAEKNIGGPVQEPEAPPPTRDAKAGDTVELVSMGTKATVLSVNKDGSLQLQAGILKISAKQSEVRVVEGETQSQKDVRKIIQRAERTLRSAAPREVDLRGMTSDEALIALENFLDTAMLGKLETVTVIHGKGTGAVRNAVRTYLKRSRYVKSFRPGRYGEGEDGVTVVELK